jgi:hypothetical protein
VHALDQTFPFKEGKDINQHGGGTVPTRFTDAWQRYLLQHQTTKGEHDRN